MLKYLDRKILQFVSCNNESISDLDFNLAVLNELGVQGASSVSDLEKVVLKQITRIGAYLENERASTGEANINAIIQAAFRCLFSEDK